MYYQRSLTVICSKDCWDTKQKKPKAKKQSVTKKAPSGIPQPVRKKVMERDNWRCRYCLKKSDGLHLHHVLYRSQGGPDTLGNLITLCMGCHELVHSNKRRWQPVLLEALRFPHLTVLEAEHGLNTRLKLESLVVPEVSSLVPGS